MHTLVIEGVIEFPECLLVGVATIKRSVVFARHKVNRWDFQCADNVFELRHAVFANLHVVGGVSEIAGEVCASAYRNQTALRSAFKDSSLYHSAPARLEKRIRSSLRREAKSEVGRRWFGWSWLPVGVALSCVLLMALVIWQAVPGLHPSGDELLAQEMVSKDRKSTRLNFS